MGLVVAGDFHLANIKDVVISWPCCLLTDVIALELVKLAHVTPQVQGTLARFRVVGAASSAFDVNRSQAVSTLLAKMIFLAVVRIGKDAYR